MSGWETVVGLEVHAQLRTRTKIFCGCSTEFGAPPNSQICPVCTGQPGVLPVLNREAVRLAVRAALALGCEVRDRSQFARKNYFYPDLPKGYQISQYDRPVAEAGTLSFNVGDAERTVRINRVHMEEDAGKSIHRTDRPVSLVDFNRAGTPLIEIVTEPDLRSADEASAYLKELRSIVRMIGVSDGNMEEGSFRCDANISMRRIGAPEYGTRVEIKNLNSFKHVRHALESEVDRQTELLEAGGEVDQETRLWDEDKGVTRTMRGKEDAHDYRYFPDPDLPPLQIDPAWLSDVPLLPCDIRVLLRNDGFDERAAAELAADPRRWAQYADFKERWGADKARSFTLSGAVPSDADLPFAVAVLELRIAGAINPQAMRRVFAQRQPGEAAAEVVARLGLEQVDDAGWVGKEVRRLVDDHPDEADRYRAGDKKVIGFFMGRAMRALQGKGDPQQVRTVLLEALDGGD